jgi:hypothetical protein
MTTHQVEAVVEDIQKLNNACAKHFFGGGSSQS